jgi:hypothetical protein
MCGLGGRQQWRPFLFAPASDKLLHAGGIVRKLLLLILSSAMLVGGLYLLAAEFLWANKIFPWAGLAGAMLVILGAYLLWTDFIASPLSGKTEQ